jgi:hypothetical protein
MATLPALSQLSDEADPILRLHSVVPGLSKEEALM